MRHPRVYSIYYALSLYLCLYLDSNIFRILYFAVFLEQNLKNNVTPAVIWNRVRVIWNRGRAIWNQGIFFWNLWPQTYRVVRKNCVFHSHYFANSPSQALGCYWLYRNWPCVLLNVSKCLVECEIWSHRLKLGNSYL